MAKKSKFHLIVDDKNIAIEARCVITVNGAYMFYDEFDIASKENLLISAYPVSRTIIVSVERYEE